MAVAVNDIYQVSYICKLAPQLAFNIRQYKVGATNGNCTEQGLADAISLSISTNYKNLLATAATYFGIDLKKWNGALWVPTVTSKSGAGAGLSTGDALPGQSCGIITLRTAVAGRANRGRAFVPFPAEFDNTSASVFPSPGNAYKTTLQTLADKMLTLTLTTLDAPAGTATLNGQVYHRGAGTFTALTVATAKQVWANQRRRGSFGQVNMDPF